MSHASEDESSHHKFSEMTRILFDRSLQEDALNDTDTSSLPTNDTTPDGFPAGSPQPGMVPMPTLVPVAPPPSGNAGEDKGGMSLKPLIYLLLFVLIILVVYKLYQAWRLRREQYLMRLRSVQADQVLGDMQMVPSEDPDAELL